MNKKCLVVFNKENYVLFLNGNRISSLLDAIRKKRELYELLSLDSKMHEFLIFDKDFDTYVHLDDDVQIDNLSKILIRSKSTDNNFLNLNYKLSNNDLCKLASKNRDEDTNESIVVSVNPSDLNNQLNNQSNNQSNNQPSKFNVQFSNQFNNQYDNQFNNQFDNSSKINEQRLLFNNLDETTNNLNNLIEPNISTFNMDQDNSESNQLSNHLSDDLILETDRRVNECNIDVDWTDNDLAILLDCCKQFIQEFTLYNISVDLGYFDSNDEDLWEQIAINVRKYTSKSYNRFQCKSRFLKLRTTYINISAYSAVENTYFGQLKYFNTLKQLIDGLKPSLDVLQLNGQLKLRKERSKERNRDKNISPAYLALIQQVKQYSRQFAGENAVSKSTVWEEISRNLNNLGYTTFTGKSSQGLFHRLRYHYLHLFKTITSEDEGKRWPYFVHFSDIDLTPFTSKRKPRKSKNKNGEDIVDEEFEDEEPDEENFENDHLDPNETYESEAKRMKNS